MTSYSKHICGGIIIYLKKNQPKCATQTMKRAVNACVIQIVVRYIKKAQYRSSDKGTTDDFARS